LYNARGNEVIVSITRDHAC